jgi:hypothetical protein
MSITGWPVSGSFVLSAAWPGRGETKLPAGASGVRPKPAEHGKQWLTKFAFEFSLLAPK